MLKGNVIHVRKNEGDLEVACDFSKHLCSVEVSPFYFGATAGLAGIYNNEPFDDFTKPDHEIASSVTEFTDSWTVSFCLYYFVVSRSQEFHKNRNQLSTIF